MRSWLQRWTSSLKWLAAARLEEVARRNGIAKSATYLDYASKHALFRAVVRQRPLATAIYPRSLTWGGARSALVAPLPQG
jgi:AcrR family transcriptional regulator